MSDRATVAPLLDVDGVSRDFDGVRALAGVALRVGVGELVCVIGPNGCGKTTLFNVITAQLRPSAGGVRFDGLPLAGLAPHRIARLGIARKFQVPSIFEDLTVAGNIDAARYGARGRAGLPAPAEVLDDVRLADVADAPAGRLSHGRKQWLEVGMLLAQAPRLMLLDEPTAGMTAAETLATVELVQRVRRRSGTACVVVEHDMRFVEALGSRVVVMLAGRVVADGAFDDVRRLPEVRDAYLGGHG